MTREYICNNPNCSDTYFESDQEPTAKTCPHCNGDDVSEVSPCCGDVIDDIRICPSCHEHV